MKFDLNTNGSKDKEWYLNGKLHRTEGPAIEQANGYKAWYLNGERHRTDGPAVEWTNGTFKEWWLNGKLHRTDGPAAEGANDYKAWYLNGERYTQEEWKKICMQPEMKSSAAKNAYVKFQESRRVISVLASSGIFNDRW